MKRWLIDTVKDSWPKCFHLAQRLGVDLLPRHFYSEIPDIARLKATQDWRRPYTFIGVNGVNVDEQLRFVRSTITLELVQRLAKGDIIGQHVNGTEPSVTARSRWISSMPSSPRINPIGSSRWDVASRRQFVSKPPANLDFNPGSCVLTIIRPIF